MSKGYLTVRTFVNNCPLHIFSIEDKFMVARLVDYELWYFGLYATFEIAEQVAKDLGNGVILEVLE